MSPAQSPPPRTGNRPNDALREISITRGFTATPAGSVLWKQGGTVVLCTASITAKVPEWFGPNKSGGWVTADYVMLPSSTGQRKDWPRIGHTDSRGTEITRLIGRVLRAAVDLGKLGPHTIALDCTVLQADGGTRTAAICGGMVALRDALRKLPADLPLPRGEPTPGWIASRAAYDPGKVLLDGVSAVSVGIVGGEVRLDLDYADDSIAEVDLNVAMTASGRFVEIQGTAEEGGGGEVDAPTGFSRTQLDAMLALAEKGCRELGSIQTA
jgi:ribonuclease PH